MVPPLGPHPSMRAIHPNDVVDVGRLPESGFLAWWTDLSVLGFGHCDRVIPCYVVIYNRSLRNPCMAIAAKNTNNKTNHNHNHSNHNNKMIRIHSNDPNSSPSWGQSVVFPGLEE